MAHWKTLAFVIVVALAGTACGDDGPRPTGSGAPATPATSETTAFTALDPGPPSAAPPVACDRQTCRVAGVRFDQPLDLEAARSLAQRANSVIVALWREEAVCVPGVGAPPGIPAEPFLEPSAFAYVDADVLRTAQDQGPPATDGGWSLAMRERFVEEWTAASRPGVMFTGAALLTREPSIEAAEIVLETELDWYLTDQTRVLYLRGHARQLAPLFDPPAASC